MAGERILVVEDEFDIRELMTMHLAREGYSVDAAADGEQALAKIRAEKHALYVFDWMLPGVSGLELTRLVRDSGAPVLMVTARAEPTDVVLGLESGADDYVTKPFEIPIFLARVRALLRRASKKAAEAIAPPAATDKLVLGGISIDLGGHEVTVDGAPVELTISEFKLLVALLQSQGKVLTRNQLMLLVQGEGVSVVDRTIDTHVFGIRKKLGTSGEMIETVRGVGYRVK